jgi:Domain of unknown function (DUF1330)
MMPERIFIIEFPTADVARRWYRSKDYQEALKARLSASHGRVILIEGNEVSTAAPVADTDADKVPCGSRARPRSTSPGLVASGGLMARDFPHYSKRDADHECGPIIGRDIKIQPVSHVPAAMPPKVKSCKVGMRQFASRAANSSRTVVR